MAEESTAWLGHATETTATVVAYCAESGTLSVEVPGVGEFSAEVTSTLNAANNYGIGVVTVTGLSPNTRYGEAAGWPTYRLRQEYGCRVKLNGAQFDTVSIRTNPVAGSTYHVGVVSCVGSDRFITHRNLEFFDLAAFVHLGDTPYADAAVDDLSFVNGDITQAAKDAAGGSYANNGWEDGELFFRKWLNYIRRPDVNRLVRRFPSWWMTDDHEHCNDFTHDLASANDANALNGALANQAAADAFWELTNGVAMAFMQGNPPNTDSGAAAQKPPVGTGVLAGASNYPVRYFGQIIGDCHHHVIDCMSHRGRAGDDSTMLGSTQLAALQARISASPATFHVIWSSKKTIGAVNDDGWGNIAPTELGTLLAWLESNATGVAWVCGDVHDPEVVARATARGDSYDHVCMNVAPSSVAPGNGTVTAGVTRWRARSETGNIEGQAALYKHTAGVVTVNGASSLRLAEFLQTNLTIDKPAWSGLVEAGSNALTYPATRTA